MWNPNCRLSPLLQNGLEKAEVFEYEQLDGDREPGGVCATVLVGIPKSSEVMLDLDAADDLISLDRAVAAHVDLFRERDPGGLARSGFLPTPSNRQGSLGL